MESKPDIRTSLFFVTFVFTVVYQIGDYSLWGFYSSLRWLFRYSALLFSMLLLLLSISKFNGKDIKMIFFALVLTVIVGQLSSSKTELLLLFALVLGAKDIPFKNIVKVHFIISLCCCLLNMVGSEMGMTMPPNSIGSERESSIFEDFVARKDFGYLWATDYATHVFFILLDYWILRNGRLRIIEVIACLYIAYFVLINTDARFSFICILLILLLTLFLFLVRKYEVRFGKVAGYLLILSIPILAILSLYATMSYDPSNIYWFLANEISSSRLSLGNDAIIEYGLPLFGQTVVFYGWGNEDISHAYDYVDSSYVQYSIKWGIILMSIIIYAFYRIAKSAFRRNDLSLLFALVLAGIAGVITQFLFYFGYCILLLALFASHSEYDAKGKIIEDEVTR